MLSRRRARRFPVATVCALGFAAFTTLTAYYGGADMILASLGAEKLNLQIPEHRELHNVVTEMALASGSPMPRIFVSFDPAPNALATGTNEKNAAICVTSGLLTLLDREETQGVIAHEMSHIRNEDILLMTLVSVLLGGIVLLSDWGRHGFLQFAVGPADGRQKPTVVFAVIAVDRLIADDRPAPGDGGVPATRISGGRDRGAVSRAIRAAWRAPWSESAMARCRFPKRAAARRIFLS